MHSKLISVFFLTGCFDGAAVYAGNAFLKQLTATRRRSTVAGEMPDPTTTILITASAPRFRAE